MSRNFFLSYKSFLSVESLQSVRDSVIKVCLYGYIPLALLFFGCSAMKQPAPLRNLGIAGDTEDVRVEVVDIIQPGDTTSWVDGARWTEVIVRVSNKSPGNLVVQMGNLVDQQGLLSFQLSNILAEQDPGERVAKMQEAQMGYGLAQQSVMSGLGYGLGYTVPYIGFLTPLMFQGLSMAQQQAMLSVQNDPQRVQAEAKKRSLPVGATLIPGGTAQGSLFFRQTQFPQKLILGYVTDTGSKSIDITLVQSAVVAQPAISANVAAQPQAGTIQTKVESRNPYVEVIANEANIREQPKTGKIIKKVNKGTRLEKVDEVDQWTKVLLGDESIGWISSGLVKQIKPVVSSPGRSTY
jgi:Bacterial SH3 domain